MADKPYKEALGSIMYSQIATRPDLGFAVQYLSRFSIDPGPAHWKALEHVMAYIRGTLDYAIVYGGDGFERESLRPVGFVDADYGGCVDTRRSTTGYIFLMAGGAIAWTSSLQATVSLSTTEAEYIALSKAAQQAMWIYAFLREIDMPQQLPALLFGDNMGSIALTRNAGNHRRAKHIDVRHHYIRERASEGDIEIIHIPSIDNVSDFLTKSLPRDAHRNIVHILGLASR